MPVERLYSASSGPQSDATSNSSLFLSPPISATRSSSPPPRPDAEDYLAARKRHRYKGKANEKRGREHHNKGEESQEAAYNYRLPRSTSPAATFPSGYCDSCTSGSDVSDQPTQMNVSLRERSTNSRRLHFSQESLKPKPLQTRATAMGLFQSPLPDITESPAAEALRKCSQPRLAESTTERNVSRRLAKTLLYTRSELDPRATDIKPRASKSLTSSTFAAQKRRNSGPCQKNKRVGEESRGNPKAGMKMPATITVRKASATNGIRAISGSASSPLQRQDLCDFGNRSSTDSSQLVAFRSTTLAHSSSGQMSPESVSRGENFIHRISSSSTSAEDRDTRKTALTFQGFNGRSRSSAAGITVTLSDVHVAPGTFCADPNFSKAWTVSHASSRRVSVVQFRSRNSVHEIVWREDESTSESGSSKVDSPRRDNLQSRTASMAFASQHQCSPKRSRATSLKHNVFPGLDVGAYFGIDENMFQWSWGKPSQSLASPDMENAPQDAESEQGARPTDEKPLFIRAVTRQDRRSSVSARGSVHSFPPLGERKSTAEWRQAPLVDINDPTAGRQPQLQAQDKRDFDGPATEMQAAVMNWAATQRGIKTRKLSTHPHAPARVGESGRIGSSIGSSSHQKVGGIRMSA